MTLLDATAASFGADARAFMLLKSGRRLDLLNPDPQAWTDDDLAEGLSRTMRWGGASRWARPLSVAQHSLTVLAIREAEGPLTAAGALRELRRCPKISGTCTLGISGSFAGGKVAGPIGQFWALPKRGGIAPDRRH